MLWPIAVVFFPLLFLVFTWTVVTACRILFPEKDALRDEAIWAEVRRRENLPASAQQIRADIRTWQQRHAASYCFDGQTGGVPDVWREDMALRRN